MPAPARRRHERPLPPPENETSAPVQPRYRMARTGSQKRLNERPPLTPVALFEEAFHLLRSAPPASWLGYCLGTFPFVLAFLYFWSDMARGLDAQSRCAPEALGLAVLFVWMGTWQSWVGAGLLAQLHGRPRPALSWRSFARQFAFQSGVQAATLALLPPAALVLLPFPWAYAWLTGAGILAWTPAPVRDAAAGPHREARRLAALWPNQNAALFSMATLLALFVYLDVLMGFALLPHLWKAITGVETEFSRSGIWLVLNTTFQAIVLGLTYVVIRPLMLAAYALRIFLGNARTTGMDLRVRFRRAAAAAGKMLPCFLILGLCLGPPAGAARETAAAPRAPVSPAAFDRIAGGILARPEFAWRLPRLRRTNRRHSSFLAAFVRDMLHTLGRWFAKVWEMLNRFLRMMRDWFRHLFRHAGGPRTPRSARESRTMLAMLAWILLVAALGFAAWLVVNSWRRRRRTPKPGPKIEVEPEPEPDLEADYVPPQDLPYRRWLDKAAELARNGEFRLAVRALHLAALGILAEHRLLQPSRSKTDGEYRREVQRHGHAYPLAPALFLELSNGFERVWYGRHPAGPEHVARARDRVEQLARLFPAAAPSQPENPS